MGKSNQKTVKVVKEKCDKDNYYTTINLNALSIAGKQLGSDAFKMWVYFSKNIQGYTFQLSSKHAEEAFNLSKRKYDNAIKELIEGGFLADSNEDPDSVQNSWTFYEIPLEDKENKPLQQNDTSPVSQENKPSITIDTRNTIDNTNKIIMKNSLFPEVKVEALETMTEREKRDYFTKNIF